MYRAADLGRAPNLLSLARIPLALLFPFASRSVPAALLVLGLAGLTDVLDGWLARRLGAETAIGAVIDPVADKIFALTVMVTSFREAVTQWLDTVLPADLYARASGSGSSARNSRSSTPRRAVMAPSTSWMRGAFCSGQVTPASATCTSAGAASRRASQVAKRSRSRLNAACESALRVRCDSSDDTSSLRGSMSS